MISVSVRTNMLNLTKLKELLVTQATLCLTFLRKFIFKMERAQHSSVAVGTELVFMNVMYKSADRRILQVGAMHWQNVSYVQQLAQDYFLFLQIITANVLRDNNMVYKRCCKAVSVSISSTQNPTLYKTTETTFTLRRFHSCHPNRLSGTICGPLQCCQQCETCKNKDASLLTILIMAVSMISLAVTNF